MRVSVFAGAGYWGLTEDWEGTNLPAERGPWSRVCDLDLSSGAGDRTGLNAIAAIIAINDEGFYVYPMKDQ
jgi:hypothetical protein